MINGSNKNRDQAIQNLEKNENNSTLQNLWDTAKAVLREKYIAIQAYLKKEEQSQMKKVTIIEIGKRTTNEALSQQKEGHNKDQRRNK